MSKIFEGAGQWIAQNVPLTILIALLIMSFFFKVAKVEINPIGWFLGLIGKSLTKDLKKTVLELKEDTNTQIRNTNSQIGELRTDLDSFEDRTNASIESLQTGTAENCAKLQSRLDDMELSNDMQTVRQIKAHVLDFANSCLNHRKHTKKDFDNIIKENEEYEFLCKKHGLKNDVYTEDFSYIMKIYHQCQDKDNFLRDSDLAGV